ncbi:heme peroxidase [Flammula alnicola]|nr:heme peroxidase [Flammula alnicola]
MIWSILQFSVLKNSVVCSDGIHSVSNAACCQLFLVLVDIQQSSQYSNKQLFDTPSCSQNAREILHLAFHDAMGFSRSSPGLGGGADGSILTFSSIEETYPNNPQLQSAIENLKPLSIRHNITDGDLLHYAAAVAISSCPGAPRLPFLFGRRPATGPASPSAGAPAASDSVTTILARFADVGFSPASVVSLLAAHSIAGTHAIDPTAQGDPLDSTPNLFDSQIFIEVLLKGTLFPGNGSNIGEVLSPLSGEVRLQSDFSLSRDSRTACTWQSMVGNQALMVSKFQAAMAQLSVVGQDTSTLVDCSEAIPIPQPLPAAAGPHLPAGFTGQDIQQACATAPFPTLPASPGQPTVSPAYVLHFL